MLNLFLLSLLSCVVIHSFEFGFEKVPSNNSDPVGQQIIEVYTAKNNKLLQNLTIALYSPYENFLHHKNKNHHHFSVELNKVLPPLQENCILFLSNFLEGDIGPLEIPAILRKPILAIIRDRFYSPQYASSKMTWVLDFKNFTGNNSTQGFFTTWDSICLIYPGGIYWSWDKGPWNCELSLTLFPPIPTPSITANLPLDLLYEFWFRVASVWHHDIGARAPPRKPLTKKGLQLGEKLKKILPGCRLL